MTTAKKVYIETVGCQMNVLDSELVVGALRRHGYGLTHDVHDADVILFNTCSVRQHAEDKIYSALGRLRNHKRQHPSKIIGVLGCMAQKDQELIRRRAPHVDIICGTGQLARLQAMLPVRSLKGVPVEVGVQVAVDVQVGNRVGLATGVKHASGTGGGAFSVAVLLFSLPSRTVLP